MSEDVLHVVAIGVGKNGFHDIEPGRMHRIETRRAARAPVASAPVHVRGALNSHVDGAETADARLERSARSRAELQWARGGPATAVTCNFEFDSHALPPPKPERRLGVAPRRLRQARTPRPIQDRLVPPMCRPFAAHERHMERYRTPPVPPPPVFKGAGPKTQLYQWRR
jgi:hypothetical protein